VNIPLKAETGLTVFFINNGVLEEEKKRRLRCVELYQVPDIRNPQRRL